MTIGFEGMRVNSADDAVDVRCWSFVAVETAPWFFTSRFPIGLTVSTLIDRLVIQ